MCVLQEADEDAKDQSESGEFSKFRLSQETIEQLKGWIYVYFFAAQNSWFD